MATSAGGMFSNFFGARQGNPAPAGGGIEHGADGRVTPLPGANPQQQLSNGQSAPVGAGGVPTTQQQQPDPLNSHLEELRGVWQTATGPDGKPLAPQADPLATQMFTFKPEDVKATTDKLDFTTSINPELLEKALGGDVQAMRDSLNAAVRTAFSAQTVHTGQMINQGFQGYGRQIDAALPSRLRQHAIATSASDDPILGHPAIAPVVAAMRASIAQQQPQLTPEQVSAAAENYVKGIGGAFNLQTTAVAAKKATAEQPDWLAWAGLKSE